MIWREIKLNFLVTRYNYACNQYGYNLIATLKKSSHCVVSSCLLDVQYLIRKMLLRRY